MPKAPLFLVKAQDTKNQSKPRAAGRSTVDQFRYFGSDCINYSNRSQIPSREIPLVAGAESVRPGHHGDGYRGKVSPVAIIVIGLACLRRTLKRFAAPRSIAR
jgi:hypothetical protein